MVIAAVATTATNIAAVAMRVGYSPQYIFGIMGILVLEDRRVCICHCFKNMCTLLDTIVLGMCIKIRLLQCAT